MKVLKFGAAAVAATMLVAVAVNAYITYRDYRDMRGENVYGRRAATA